MLIFQRAILTLLSDVCKRGGYSHDGSFFVFYIEFMNLMVRNNDQFYDIKEIKIFIYEFIVNHCINLSKASDLKLQDAIKVLHELIEIAYMKPFDEFEPALIKESAALKALYKILRFYFKQFSEDQVSSLVPYIFSPLIIAAESFFNYCLLSEFVAEDLISILKRINNPEIRLKIYKYIVEIGKINSTTKFLSRMIKNLPKNLGMFDALIELISNKTFSSAFFFNEQ